MTFFGQCTRDAYALFKDALYLVDGTRPLANFDGDRITWTSNDATLCCPLLPLPVESLWTVYESTRRKDLETHIRAIIDENAEESFGRVLRKETTYVKLLSMVLFDISTCFLPSDAEDRTHAREGETYTNTLLLDYLESKLMHYKNIDSTLQTQETPPLENFATFFAKNISRTFNEAATFYDGQQMSFLCPGKGTTTLKIGTQTYCKGGPINAINDFSLVRQRLDLIFSDYWTKVATHHAITRALENKKFLEADKRKLNILAATIDKKDVDFGTWGVLLDGPKIIMYVNVPRYALRDWLNAKEEYYAAFPPAKVAIHISPNTQPSLPFILGDYSSPFCSGKNAEICMGRAWYNGLPILDKLPIPERCATYLADAAKIITRGYTVNGYGGQTRTLSVFKQVPKEYLEREGIPITNIEGGTHEHA
ncbi:hypothetical protein HY490_02115 [Candidatus Woesearchaeota archaeon]|nr:hypothetical protein [Candidatus Woesearchaeota archaeon]